MDNNKPNGGSYPEEGQDPNVQGLQHKDQHYDGQQYDGQGYQGQQFQGQQYPHQQFPDQQYPGQQYSHQQFPDQQYPNPQYQAQQYGPATQQFQRLDGFQEPEYGAQFAPNNPGYAYGAPGAPAGAEKKGGNGAVIGIAVAVLVIALVGAGSFFFLTQLKNDNDGGSAAAAATSSAGGGSQYNSDRSGRDLNEGRVEQTDRVSDRDRDRDFRQERESKMDMAGNELCGKNSAVAWFRGTNVTSCSFATEVAKTATADGRTRAGVYDAYSDVTGKWYRMNCDRKDSYTVKCTGGNNAVVFVQEY